jgi:hypothetical protein
MSGAGGCGGGFDAGWPGRDEPACSGMCRFLWERDVDSRNQDGTWSGAERVARTLADTDMCILESVPLRTPQQIFPTYPEMFKNGKTLRELVTPSTDARAGGYFAQQLLCLCVETRCPSNCDIYVLNCAGLHIVRVWELCVLVNCHCVCVCVCLDSIICFKFICLFNLCRPKNSGFRSCAVSSTGMCAPERMVCVATVFVGGWQGASTEEFGMHTRHQTACTPVLSMRKTMSKTAAQTQIRKVVKMATRRSRLQTRVELNQQRKNCFYCMMSIMGRSPCASW